MSGETGNCDDRSAAWFAAEPVCCAALKGSPLQSSWRTAFAVVLAFLSAGTSAEEPDRWQLMARHGECAEISGLRRLFPDMENVTTPDAFAQFVAQKGMTAKIETMPVPVGKLRSVEISEKQLHLLFATHSLCLSLIMK